MRESPNRLLCGVVTVVICIHVGLLGWGAFRHSPNVDEAGHLPAGLGHWRHGAFDLYRVDPPLVRLAAALPVLCTQAITPSPVEWRDVPGTLPPELQNIQPTQLPARRSEVIAADLFVRWNGERTFGYFTMARLACIPFSLVGALICFRWAKELYGAPAGVWALVLWCFSPNIIAHGQMITPAAASAAMGLAAAYSFWRWLKSPTWGWTLAAGSVLGLAGLSEMIWIALFGLWPFLWILWRVPDRKRLSRPQWAEQAGQVTAILLLGLNVVNLGYGLQGSFRQLGAYGFVSQALTGGEDRSDDGVGPGNRFDGTWLGELPLPFPEDYVIGVDYTLAELEHERWQYLGGEWRKGGWWYDYLYALAIKMPLGTWMLVLLAILAALFGCGYSAGWREELMLAAPLLAVLVLVGFQAGHNRQLHSALPALPLVFILTSRLTRAVGRWRRGLVLTGGALLVWAVTSSLWIYPHSLSYFNELVGGPTGGHFHLSGRFDSHVDWGQDLLYLKRWLEAHPDARPLVLGVGPPLDPVAADIVHRRLSERPFPGWCAVSVDYLHARTGRYSYFQQFEPVGTAGYSVHVYHFGLDDVNRIRRELEIPELPAR